MRLKKPNTMDSDDSDVVDNEDSEEAVDDGDYNDDDDDNGEDDEEDDEASSKDGSEVESAEDEVMEGAENLPKSHVSDDVEKGKHTIVQIKLWEDLLKLRINLQKAMVIVNQLPQPSLWNEFITEGGEPCQHAAVKARVGLKHLLDQLFQLQTLQLASNSETKSMLQAGGENEDDRLKDKSLAKANADDEEITSESEAGSDKEDCVDDGPVLKKLKMAEYPEVLATRHKVYQNYRNSTIQKWDDKTRVMSGKVGKGFGAFDQSAVKQIQLTLADKERLMLRTRINRLGHRVLGKQVEVSVPQSTPADDEELPVLPRDPLKDADDEIFDDNDFYHHILREFIQHKNSYDPVVLTKQWLEIQQYRKKAKRNIDRKASKNRKTRYNVHKPLVNFMAPFHNPDLWTDEQCDDLFKNLFGRSRTHIT